jgi:hypothetical protein
MKVVAEHYHQEYIYQFLMGLNESLAAIRGQILLMEPLPTVNKVFSFVIQEEKQQEISVKSHSQLGFYCSHDSISCFSNSFQQTTLSQG